MPKDLFSASAVSQEGHKSSWHTELVVSPPRDKKKILSAIKRKWARNVVGRKDRVREGGSSVLMRRTCHALDGFKEPIACQVITGA